MTRMRRALPPLVFTAFALLFLIVNRGAYEGFFHGDELDNIQWTRYLSASDWARGLFSLKYYPQNFRPVGHFYFNLMGRLADLRFPWYVLTVHALHLFNVCLLWRLLRRRLGLPLLAAAAGSLFFAFHMGVFDALWKPMYIFDLLAACFSLLCLLLYTRGGTASWAASLAAFWLALKSKEMAVMIPAALASWELWLGGRKWARLAPFLAVSLVFGLQALAVNTQRDSEYTLLLTPEAIWKSARFYASKIFLLPYAGFALAAVVLLVRDRRLWFGMTYFLTLLLPMLLLSRRLFGAYLYAPLAGLAMAGGVIASRSHPAAIAAFFLVWLPLNHAWLRAGRREALSLADENRRYVTRLADIVRANPEARAFVYDGVPAALHTWGIAAATRYFAGRGDLEFYPVEEQDLAKILDERSGVVLLSWDPLFRELRALARTPQQPEASYISLSRLAPVWQFGQGWYALTGQFRWCRPYATARLRRPPGATHFELVVNMGPPPVREPVQASVLLDGRLIGEASLARGSGWHKLRWAVPPGQPGPVRVEFRVAPPFVADERHPLGLAVGGFGFVSQVRP